MLLIRASCRGSTLSKGRRHACDLLLVLLVLEGETPGVHIALSIADAAGVRRFALSIAYVAPGVRRFTFSIAAATAGGETSGERAFRFEYAAGVGAFRFEYCCTTEIVHDTVTVIVGNMC